MSNGNQVVAEGWRVDVKTWVYGCVTSSATIDGFWGNNGGFLSKNSWALSKVEFKCEIALNFMWRCEKKKKTIRNNKKWWKAKE